MLLIFLRLLVITILLSACTAGGELSPLEPPQVSAIPASQQVNLHWQHSEDAQFYKVYYSSIESDIPNVSEVLQTESNEIIVTNLQNGEIYYFTVTAVGDAGESKIVDIIEVTPQAPPQKPVDIKIEPGYESVTVSWSDSTRADSYNIYLARSPDINLENYSSLSGWIKVTGVESPFKQTGLINGIEHYVVVTAVNQSGESAVSNETAFVPTATIDTVVGDNHVCSILIDQSMWCWGENGSGQLGDGARSSKAYPVKVKGNKKWKTVALGYENTCAIDEEQTLWCWGDIVRDEEFGNVDNFDEPTEIGIGKNWAKIITGEDLFCGITEDSISKCWGNHDYQPDSLILTGFKAYLDVNEREQVSISIGSDISCAINDEQKLWCWGENSDGHLGYGYVSSEVEVSIDIGEISSGWYSVSSSSSHSCGIKNDGSLWCWGANDNGQLGVKNIQSSNHPIVIDSAIKWKSISVSNQQNCGIKLDNTLWCWGSNAYGRLGVEDTEYFSIPTKVGIESNWKSVSTFEDNTCATKLDGSVWCTGSNSYGQLGNGDTNLQIEPTKVLTNAVHVDTHSSSVCAINDKDELMCWGDHDYYDKNGEFTLINQQPYVLDQSKSFKSVSHSALLSCGLTTTEEIYCWGTLKQGDESINLKKLAYVDIESNWKLVASNYYSICGINQFAELWCFDEYLESDENNKGIVRLNEGYQIDIGKPWVSVYLGPDFTCAIDQDNMLWCWGVNDPIGFLGIGDDLELHIPEQWGLEQQWQKVSLDSTHICGITLQSKLLCWGQNSYGQLGIESTLSADSPQLISKNDNWLDVSVDDYRTCAVKDDNTLWCWGVALPTDAFLLDKVTFNDSPKQYGKNIKWEKVSVSNYFLCGLDVENNVYCMGNNKDGQVGNGKAWSTAFQQVDLREASGILQ